MAESAQAKHPAGYQSNPFELFQPSYEGARLNLKPYLLLILAAIGVFGGLALVGGLIVGLLFKAVPIIGVLAAVALAAAFVLLLVYITPIPYRLTLAMARHKKVEFGDLISNPFNLGWKMFYTQLLAGLIVIGGFILLVVPGLIFSVWYMFVPYVVLEEGLTGMAALRRSKQLVANRFWDTAGAATVSSIFGVLSFIPVLGTLVGVVAAFVLVAVPAVRYDQLKKLKEHHDGADLPTSPWNYVSIAVYILFSGASYSSSLHNLQKNSQPTKTANPYYMEYK